MGILNTDHNFEVGSIKFTPINGVVLTLCACCAQMHLWNHSPPLLDTPTYADRKLQTLVPEKCFGLQGAPNPGTKGARKKVFENYFHPTKYLWKTLDLIGPGFVCHRPGFPGRGGA